MNKERSDAVKRLLDRIVVRLFGHKCGHCGSRDTEYSSYRWARGWNNLCEQAYGDAGTYCHQCGRITWDTTLEEHMKTLPQWCKPYNAE